MNTLLNTLIEHENYLKRFIGEIETYIEVPTGDILDDGKIKTYPGLTRKYKLVYDPELDENL